nr:PREDICTED: interleukin-17F-like [Latimeria chalumnae]|eukprot:XP_014352142.1 PREDICTED: interleukin-17F-like [Latimeria chalumnae]
MAAGCKKSTLLSLFLWAIVLVTVVTEAAAKGREKQKKGKSVEVPGRQNCMYQPSKAIKMKLTEFTYGSDNTEKFGDVHSRSISPWNYTINHDPNRIPSEIREAKCLYMRCLDARGEQDNQLNSVPIKQEILVIKRHWKQCKYSYKLQRQVLIVGCSCVRPRVQTST